MTLPSTLGPLIGTDPDHFPILDVLDHFYEGVMMTDASGVIVYFNETQAVIDDLAIKDVIGHSVTDVYRVDEGVSPIMQCLRTGKSVDNLACYYRTPTGKIVNSIHNVFPLRCNKAVTGTICFVRDYKLIEKTYGVLTGAGDGKDLKAHALPGRPQEKKRRPNGTRFSFSDIVGRNPELLLAIDSAKLTASSPSPVMIVGETGSGKELLAQSIHNYSTRSQHPYLAVNCAAIPENLLEGILFGTSRGAFTGAIDKPGLFEQANGGSILLDEINAMSLGLQAKLLRVLQEQKIRRIGSLHELEIDLKIISAVNKAPHLALADGTMRADLFYRVGVVFIHIPALRHRMDDLVILIDHFLTKCSQSLGKNIPGVSDQVMALFRNHQWPGNVRELEHAIEGAMNLAVEGEEIMVRHFTGYLGQLARQDRPVPSAGRISGWSSEAERKDGRGAVSLDENQNNNLLEQQDSTESRSIRHALSVCCGHAARAARRLGISPQLLNYKLKKYGIDRKSYQIKK